FAAGVAHGIDLQTIGTGADRGLLANPREFCLLGGLRERVRILGEWCVQEACQDGAVEVSRVDRDACGDDFANTSEVRPRIRGCNNGLDRSTGETLLSFRQQ